MGFEPAIPEFERVAIFRAADGAITVEGMFDK
jgi:hypothetical protein